MKENFQSHNKNFQEYYSSYLETLQMQRQFVAIIKKKVSEINTVTRDTELILNEAYSSLISSKPNHIQQGDRNEDETKDVGTAENTKYATRLRMVK